MSASDGGAHQHEDGHDFCDTICLQAYRSLQSTTQTPESEQLFPKNALRRTFASGQLELSLT